MQIVLGTYSLEGTGGMETYAITVADHLQRLGHDVWLHTLGTGRGSALAERLGIRVTTAAADLPSQPDVLVTQDGVVACELAASHPLVPQVFVAHSDIFDLALPPQLPGLTSAVVALYDRVDRRLRALALDHQVVRLSQPVDVERFKPNRPLPSQPRVAVLFGNYVYGQRLELVRRACQRAGLELRHAGRHGDGREVRPELLLNEADIAIGKARVIVEAMACGRAAYVFDHNGGEGWVTPETYQALAADNFGGQSQPAAIDEDRLTDDLAGYRSQMGIVNRDLAVAHNSATKHAAALVEVLRRAAPRARRIEAPLQELARMVRLYHRADSLAFDLKAQAEHLWAQIEALQGEVQHHTVVAEQARTETERARAEALAVRVELESARGELGQARAEAARAQRAFQGVVLTRRWRAVQALLRPIDRVRLGG